MGGWEGVEGQGVGGSSRVGRGGGWYLQRRLVMCLRRRPSAHTAPHQRRRAQPCGADTANLCYGRRAGGGGGIWGGGIERWGSIYIFSFLPLSDWRYIYSMLGTR